MSKRKKDRIDTSGGDDNGFGFNPFDSLKSDSLPAGEKPVAKPKPMVTRKVYGGRLEIKREKSGRGGKTVTTIYGITQMEAREKKELLPKLKKKLATGGTIAQGCLEIQGDLPDRVLQEVTGLGYKAVRAGG